ncbi:hypothetical protein SPHINGO8AM_50008 [Sphingomonas sp. 8AM]|nr:hypothetical protein SPHINGO8AM_50008 [Sphingomonas sp. 8AM]
MAVLDPVIRPAAHLVLLGVAKLVHRGPLATQAVGGDRRVVGWTVGDRLHRDLALAALRKALFMQRPPDGLIHHSDRGSQYCFVEYQTELRRYGIRISMSEKGNRYDNAMVETVFKTIKFEVVWRTVFYTRAEAATAIAHYIDGLYNPVRRHSALDYTTPAQRERNVSR